MNGPRVATAMTANRMEKVTVERYRANPMTNAPNATVTRTRQPIAARRLSQLGTVAVGRDGGWMCGVVSKRHPSLSMHPLRPPSYRVERAMHPRTPLGRVLTGHARVLTRS